MTTLALFLAATPVSTIAFGRIEQAHSHLGAAAFVASSKVTGFAQDVSAKYEIAYRWPSEMRLRQFRPGTNTLIRERVIEPSRVIDYDPSLLQYTEADRAGNEPLGKTLADLDQDMDDLLLAYSHPAGFDVWLTDMVKLPAWKVTSRSGRFSLTYSKSGQKIALEAGTDDGLLRRVDITTGPQRLVWTISYAGSVPQLGFRPPGDATRVPVFDREMKPPNYADAKARAVAETMFRAYEGLSAIGFDVSRDTGTTKVQVRGKFVRQDDDAATWTYDGKTLTYHDKRTDTWSWGALGFSDVLDAVGSHGTRVDPTVRLLMMGFNPYRKRLGDGATVKVAGSMSLDGRSVTILESESENALVTLFVRDDGLVVGSTARAKDLIGSGEETVDLRYRYFDVPNDLSSRARLQIPSGERPTQLKPRPTN